MTNAGGYRLEGQEIESCNCMTLCPCVLGDDPDHGGCEGVLARRITRGQIRGVDVAGLTWLEVFQSPGNMNKGNIRKLVYVDRSASLEQLEALRDAFEGRLGGPLAELAQLDGERLGIVQAEIAIDVKQGRGQVSVGGKLHVVMTPHQSTAGTATTLHDSRFSTVPGAPAWMGKSDELAVVIPEHGLQFTYEGTSAIEGGFIYENRG
jgi:hypothetical protein